MQEPAAGALRIFPAERGTVAFIQPQQREGKYQREKERRGSVHRLFRGNSNLRALGQADLGRRHAMAARLMQ